MSNPMKLILSLTCTTLLNLLPQIVSADSVELMLTDRLDGDLDAYCIDIIGPKQKADISRGLQTHTCYAYQGQMGIDQMFDSEKFSQNRLFMPEFDACVTLSGLVSGASVGLATCDGSEEQAIELTVQGRLSPVAAPDMCLTAGDTTRLGRGGTSRHQIKSLTLEPCSDDRAAYQAWEPRAS